MIRWFKDTRKEDVDVAGGKGANLGEMTHCGISVPDGFVVTSSTYNEFLDFNSLLDPIRKELEAAGTDVSRLTECAGKFREQIREAKMPDSIRDEIISAYRKLGDRARVAVRSSATAEDLPDASFAGQQETYLNVCGEEELIRSVINCYASLWGDRAVIYRQNHGYDQTSVALAVVVQEMVESEVAGVLFTVNPVSRNKDEMQINASYGLGESVVSGKVTADTYVTDKEGNIKSFNIGSKATAIIYSEDGGTKEISTDEESRAKRALEDDTVKKLCMEAAKVEKYYGMPMDIEWGMRDGAIYILQARAITTLKDDADPEEEKLIQTYLDRCVISASQRSSMGFMLEKMPFPYLPMDYDLIELIDDQKDAIFAEGGIVIGIHPQIDDDGVSILPADKKSINSKIFNLPHLVKEMSDHRHCEQVLKDKMPEFHSRLSEIMNADYKSMTLKQCGNTMEKMRDLINDLAYYRFKYALFSTFLLKSEPEKKLRKIDKKYTVYDLYKNLDNETSVMSRDVELLAFALSKDEAVKDAITGGMGYSALIEKYPDTKAIFDKFLEKHGYKSDYNCYCTIAKTFHEDPDRMIRLARPLMGQPLKEEKDMYTPLMMQLKEIVGEKKYPEFEKKVENIRYFHVIREETQMMWETVFYYTRRLLERASFILYGTKDYSDNIVYLFIKEFLDVCAAGCVMDAYEEKITRRKAKRVLADKVWEGAKLMLFDDTGDELKGVSGSTGEAVGKACLINGPEEFYKFTKGDVLVCKLTDPEWTPLFSLASAVVADTGAELSHAAIVAREYGIPAVLGVGLATAKFKDGDMILVNGNKGEVKKVG